MTGEQYRLYLQATKHLRLAARDLDALHHAVHVSFRNLATAVREILEGVEEVWEVLDPAEGDQGHDRRAV